MFKRMDKALLISVALLVAGGFFIFYSAALSLKGKDGADFSNVVFKQVVFGLGLGLVACLLISKINYKFWKKASLVIFIASLWLMLLVFVPGLGMEHGGAKRWLDLGPLSFQPAEILKFSYILILASWFSSAKKGVETFRHGLLPLGIITVISIFLLLAQSDVGTLGVICFSGLFLFFLAGAKIRYVLLVIILGVVLFCSVAYFSPYRFSRIMVFLHPDDDPTGEGYQLRQSLIAVGSGGLFGRGLGMGIQKFTFLPEPMGDSIFSSFSEDFGFAGAVVLIFIFLVFAWRGFVASSRAPDAFGGLLGSGIVILIITQAFINICAMIGLVPLTGIPLIFVSQGGSALLIALAEIGVLLNISKS